MRICKNCSEIANDDEVFCPNCGGNEFMQTADVFCHKCGARCPADFTHCVNCGALLKDNAVGSNSQADSVENSQAQTSATEVPVDVKVTEIEQVQPNIVVGNAVSAKFEQTNNTVNEAIPEENAQSADNALEAEDNIQGEVDLTQVDGAGVQAKAEVVVPRSADAVRINQAYKLPQVSEIFPVEKREEQPVETVVEKSHCPNCNFEFDINSLFCPKCGYSVMPINRHKQLKRKICPRCGTANAINEQYCSYCFTSLAGAEIDDYMIEFIDVTRDKDNVIRQAVLQSPTSKKSLICGNCGSLNSLEQKFCVKCGLNLQVELKKKFCVVCGTANNYDALFCTKCQYSFSGVSQVEMEGSWKCDCGEINDKQNVYCIKCGKAKNSTVGGKR